MAANINNIFRFFCVFWIIPITSLAQPEIPLQANHSGAHSNTTNEFIRLSGGFGQPLANSESMILKSGFFAAAMGIIVENDTPMITILNEDEITSFVLGSPASIIAQITDRDGLDYAALWIRPISSSRFDSVALHSQTDNKYSYEITNTNYDNMGIEYYFAARDNTNRRRRFPSSGNLYAYTINPQPEIPNERLNHGSKEEDYRIITIPYQEGQNAVTTLFSVLTEQKYDRTKWRLFSHEGGNEFKEFPDVNNFIPGYGYWLLISDKNAVTLTLGNNFTAPLKNQSELFSLPLKNGWNMVGNPYTEPIDWSSVRSLNSSINIGKLKLFEGEYENEDILQPYQGGVVYLDEPDTSIDIPFYDAASGGRIQKDNLFSSDLSSDIWGLDLIIEQGERRNSMGGIGMHPDAAPEKDHFDDHNPPRFMSYLEVNFPHPEHPLGSFCRDIVETQYKYHWDFTIDATNDDPITLKWSNSRFGNNDVELYLYDISAKRIVDMLEVDSYNVHQNSAYKIYYGEDVLSDFGPGITFTGLPYPNPYRPGSELSPMIFPMVLARSSRPYDIRLNIYDLQGRIVKQIISDGILSGYHKVTWYGLTEEGAHCAPGIYMYHIQIADDQKISNFSGRTVIAK